MVTFRTATSRAALRCAVPLAIAGLAASASAQQALRHLRLRAPVDPTPTVGPADASPVRVPGDPIGAPTVSRQRLLHLVNQLNDLSSEQREAARDALLNLSASDLPHLTSVAAELAPLTLEQRDIVREVAIHLYLSACGYDAEPPTAVDRLSCMGVTLGRENDVVPLEDGTPVEALPIIGRLQGFPAYAALRDGDEIVAARTPSAATLVDGFRDFIASRQPGTVVTVVVMREGKLVAVDVRLRPRPYRYGAPFQVLGDWMSAWRQTGEDWWYREVDPTLLLPVGVRAPSTQP